MGNYQWGMLNVDEGTFFTQHCPPSDPDRYIVPKPPEITHDPLEGFPNGRKPRVMKVTKEEMMSAKLPLLARDYCADKLIKFKNCRFEKFPFVVLCHREMHDYEHCEFEDFVLRLKEAEREKRLRERDALRAKKEGLVH